MDAKSIDLARKLNAQMASDKEDGEVARRKLNALLAQHGKSMGDLPAILGQGNPSSAPGSGADEGFWRRMWEYEQRLRQTGEREAEERGRQQERERIAKQKQAEARAERDRQMAEKIAKKEREDAAEAAKDARERRAVIKRYGSEAAVLVPCEREKLLKAAVRQWTKFYTTGDPEWTTSICRCRDFATVLGRKKKLMHIIDAIAAAYPLPETIEGVIAEKAYWDRRVRETALVRKYWYYVAGDLTIQIRQHVLQGLIDTTPAKTVRDVLARMQDRDMTPELQKAVIADLKALSAATETVVSHEEFRAARQKREAPVSKAEQPKQRPAIPGQQTFGF